MSIDQLNEARLVNAAISETISAQEKVVIDRMIGEYKNGTKDFIGWVAEISALRDLKQKIEKDINKALKEG